LQSNKIVVSLDDDQDENEPQNNESRIREIGFEEDREAQKSHTFEFDDVRSTIDRFQKRTLHGEEPHYKQEQPEPTDEDRKAREIEEARRRERLRAQQVKLSTPKAINELENEPAYIRRGIKLDDVPQSNHEPVLSRWTISDEEEPDLNSGNSFLHDNVD